VEPGTGYNNACSMFNPRHAASAAYRMTYNDEPHFNRNYKNFFGAPSVRDVQRLREEASASAA